MKWSGCTPLRRRRCGRHDRASRANRPWLSDPESAALQRKLEQMGLEERVPSASDTWRNTPLGRELHLDLLMVFMGLWDQWEIPMILEDHGLIDDLEAEHMQDLLQAGRDPDSP
jgi:hypothetical protein